MATRTRVVLLMHPKEFKQEKAATGRLTHLCLSNSEIVVGTGFDETSRVGELRTDPRNRCVLLYPGKDAVNLSTADPAALDPFRRDAAERQLVVFILDATWALARKMLRLSPLLQQMPRVMFTPSAPSRYLIKQQPAPGCLSTLEAVHELLSALEAAGLDRYPDRQQLLDLFARMQQFQIDCARDPQRAGYRRSEYRPPAERKPAQGRSGKRRTRMFRV
jgi:DTW domain-containing protein YfiP